MKLRNGNIIVCDCDAELNPDTITNNDFIKFNGITAICERCHSTGAISLPVKVSLPPIFPNGVDDTAALQKCNGKSIKLGEGVFITTRLHFGANTHIVGAGIGKTIIKLKDNTNDSLIEFFNAPGCSLESLTLDGNRANNTVDLTATQKGILVIGTTIANYADNYYFTINNLAIENGQNNGLALYSPNTSKEYGYNWVLHINNLYSRKCNKYCMYDASQDNTFSNLYLSEGGWADLYSCGSSNMYVNVKCDGQGGRVYTTDEAVDRGAQIIVYYSTNLRFVNLDCQSAQYVGMKVLGGKYLNIDGCFNNNGLQEEHAGSGLRFYNSSYITTKGMFYTLTPGVQEVDVFIDSYCKNISVITEIDTTDRIINNGIECKIIQLSKL